MTKLYSIRQLASLAGISRQRLHVLRREGRGPQEIRYKVGFAYRVKFPAGPAEAWIVNRDPERAGQVIGLHLAAGEGSFTDA